MLQLPTQQPLPAALVSVTRDPRTPTPELKDGQVSRPKSEFAAVIRNKQARVSDPAPFPLKISLGLRLLKTRGLPTALCNLGSHQPGLSSTNQEP